MLPLEEVKRKLDKQYGKMTIENEINEIWEELDLRRAETNLVNNTVPKSEEFDESFRRNTHFTRPRYVPVGRTTNFPLGSP